jgi:hypothetical protein
VLEKCNIRNSVLIRSTFFHLPLLTSVAVGWWSATVVRLSALVDAHVDTAVGGDADSAAR